MQNGLTLIMLEKITQSKFVRNFWLSIQSTDNWKLGIWKNQIDYLI